ncbi:MAG: alkaline phosphatase [Saprospiraceae bacterium]|jgi:alkaline phosphatase
MRSLFFLWILLIFSACKAPYLPLPSYHEIDFEERPKNIILLIGDGMSLAQISAAIYSTKSPFHLEQFPVIGLHKTHSSSDLITDSAAAATTFATGIKTYNNAIGVDVDSIPLYTILEEARDRNMATGLVTTVPITHATPASFAAHQNNRVFSEKIALDLSKSGVDLMIGGGQKHFERRDDDRDLLQEMQAEGYRTESYFYKNLDKINLGTEDKLIYFSADDSPLSVEQGRDYLPFASIFATHFLERRSDKGFFLMLESGQIDWGGHANDGRRVVSETLEFNRVIGNILRYAAADKETLVIVTADHETGGLALNPKSKMGKPKMAFNTNGHTAQLVPVFAYGPQSQLFSGIYDNTMIYHKMRKALGWTINKSQ